MPAFWVFQVRKIKEASLDYTKAGPKILYESHMPEDGTMCAATTGISVRAANFSISSALPTPDPRDGEERDEGRREGRGMKQDQDDSIYYYYYIYMFRIYEDFGMGVSN